jgi:hypothetical protein
MGFESRDFSIFKYKALCQALVDTGYTCMTMHQYLESRPDQLPEKLVLLRHDVDRFPGLSLQFAELEEGVGLKATYYFRVRRASFNPAIMKKIHQLGHEIGYHYETLSDTRGDVDQALDLFAQNLAMMRDIVPVATAAMHGRPLSRWDNRLMWDKAQPEQFGLSGEAYLSLDYGRLDYFSDTGRTWHPSRFNIKDTIKQQPRYIIETTDDLIEHIRSGKSNHICLLTHPERWPSSPVHWAAQTSLDLSLNLVKAIFVFIKGR